MSSQTLVRNQVLSAIVGTLYKDQQVEHLRRQLAIFTREWNNLPIVMWRKMLAPNTTMQLDNFTTGTTAHLKSVRKTLQKAMQQPQRVLGIILIMDNPHGKPSHARSPHDKVSQVGVLAHIRRAQWLGEDYRVVVDGDTAALAKYSEPINTPVSSGSVEICLWVRVGDDGTS
ncbi:hypothetical protein V8C43DRAFT_303108 [Trichoderma afarasin]